MTEYKTIRTPNPPVLAIEDGELVIKLTDGPLTMVATIGDGTYFFSQVVARLVDPALRTVQQIKDAQAMTCYPAGTYVPLASPND